MAGLLRIRKRGDFVKVVVVGAGAVGLLTASFLAEAGIDVTVAVRRQDQAQELNKAGLTRVNLDGTKVQRQISATTSLSTLPRQDLAVIAVKYGQLHTLYEELSALPKDVPLLFMQNGLAHYEEALQLHQVTIGFCSVAFGAQVKNNTTVLHKGLGPCQIAAARGNQPIFLRLEKIANPSFPIILVQDAERMLFEKAVLNCLINPLTAILQVKNGELLTNGQAFLIMQTLYNEVLDAFPGLDATVAFSDVVILCEKTAANTSSMLADRLNGRKSEIDTIVGSILTRALNNGHTLPTLRTLYHQVLAIEKSGEHN